MSDGLIRVAVIGAGSRGALFGDLLAASGLARVTAVAEPRRRYREHFAARSLAVTRAATAAWSRRGWRRSAAAHRGK